VDVDAIQQRPADAGAVAGDRMGVQRQPPRGPAQATGAPLRCHFVISFSEHATSCQIVSYGTAVLGRSCPKNAAWTSDSCSGSCVADRGRPHYGLELGDRKGCPMPSGVAQSAPVLGYDPVRRRGRSGTDPAAPAGARSVAGGTGREDRRDPSTVQKWERLGYHLTHGSMPGSPRSSES